MKVKTSAHQHLVFRKGLDVAHDEIDPLSAGTLAPPYTLVSDSRKGAESSLGTAKIIAGMQEVRGEGEACELSLGVEA